MRRLFDRFRYFWQFFRYNSRVNTRAKRWVVEYKKYLAGDQIRPPLPAVVQLTATEHCNLRCPMCNQWGENGYFLTGKKEASHLDGEKLILFLNHFKSVNPAFTLSIHGGEPFAYKHISTLLDWINETKVDVLFTTNGTLLKNSVDRLAKINRHVAYYISIDGGEDTNDKIRGKGATQKIIEQVDCLRQACAKAGTGLPKIMINYCLCEHNPQALDDVESVAHRLGAFLINYNFRWYLSPGKGEEYDQVLINEFKVKPTRAWTGWVTDNKFENIGPVIKKLYQKINTLRLFPPYINMIPKGLKESDALLYYQNYNEMFGIKGCIMPSYWARIDSLGNLLYCPGHPDILPGNVFENDFRDLYYGSVSTQLRKKVEKELLPICHRCCGLFVSYPVTKKLGGNFFPNPS